MHKLIVIVLLLPTLAFAYTPPKGIPNPAGSFSTFGEIDQATPATATKCPNWPSAETSGCYYIDKTVSCSDANTYGYPNSPRCKIPTGALAAGSFLYINAGTYGVSDTTAGAGTDIFWYGAGSAGEPIWITANAANAVTTAPIHIGGCKNNSCAETDTTSSYIVLENFHISGGSGVQIAPINGYNADHIIVRNNTMTGRGISDDTSGIAIGNTAGTDPYPSQTWTDIVIYNNTLASFGDDATTDECGIEKGYHTDRTWVLNNTVSDMGADGVCGSHYSNYTDKLSSNYFIGGNTLSDNGENCIDIKTTDGVIISENNCTGPASREGGGGIVLHYGANNLACKDAWVIFNRVYSVANGVGMGGSFGCDDCHYIGNVFSDITNDYAPTPDATYGNYGIQMGGSHGAMSIVDNTFYNCVKGVYVEDLTEGDSLKIHGNIFYHSTSNYSLYESGSKDYIDLDYNLAYVSGGSASFYWNGGSRDLTYMKETASECANCAEGDPKFVSATNFTLQSNSPAIGANVEGPVGATVYDAFATAWSAYSVTIEKDYAGLSRPQGGSWDIGAYEYDPATVRSAMSIGAGAGVSIGSGATMTLY